MPFAIQLSDTARTVPGWRFPTAADAHEHIDRVRLCHPPDWDDPRWVAPVVFQMP